MTGEQPAAGTLATEAALLLDAVVDRLTTLRPDAADPADGGAAHAAARCPECGTVPGAACTACPLCRFLAVIRGERPETAARFVDGALLVVRGLRSMLPEPDGPAGGASSAPEPAAAPAMSVPNGSQAQPDRASPRAARPGAFERIDIR